MTDSTAMKTTTYGATMKILLFVLTILCYSVASNEKYNDIYAFETTQNFTE